jgi:hypothetical protein
MFRIPAITPVSGVYPPQIFANMTDSDYDEPLFIPPFPRKPISEERRFVKREIQLKDNKITEDVYTYENRNGKKRTKKTHRVIPLRKLKPSKTRSRQPKPRPNRKPKSPPAPTPTPVITIKPKEDILDRDREMLTPPPLTIRDSINLEPIRGEERPKRLPISPLPLPLPKKPKQLATATSQTPPVSSIGDRMPTPYPKTFTDNIRFMRTNATPKRNPLRKTQGRRQRKHKKRANSRS